MDPNHQALIDKAAIKLCPIGIKLIQEENDIQASRGGINTVYHACDIYQGRPNYATCLMVIEKAMAHDEYVGQFRPNCYEAIANKTCPALAMRKAEIAAGKALFFVNYLRLMELRKEQAALDLLNSPIQFRRNSRNPPRFVPTQPENIPVSTETKQPVAKPEVKVEDEYNTNIMEQVLKKVLNDESN